MQELNELAASLDALVKAKSFAKIEPAERTLAALAVCVVRLDERVSKLEGKQLLKEIKNGAE